MSEPRERFDFLRIAGFGRRKKPERDKKYATFNRRMIAGTLDSILLVLAMPIFNYLAPIRMDALNPQAIDPQDPRAGRIFLSQALGNHVFVESWLANFFLQMFAFCLFSGVCWRYWSATPGKMLLRIKVVDAESEGAISNKQIILRLIGYFLSALPLCLGFLWIGIDKRHQAWHDKLAGTVALVVPWRKAKSGSPAADPSDSPAPS